MPAMNCDGSAGVPPLAEKFTDRMPVLPTDIKPMSEIEEIQIHKRRLPYWQQSGLTYFVTFRLADSLPREKLEIWKAQKNAWLRLHPEPLSVTAEDEYHRLLTAQIEKWLDAGSGSCILKNRLLAQIVSDALFFFDGSRYILRAFVVMPNHVHVLFTPLAAHKMEDILHSLKSFSAKKINAVLGRSGQIWQEEYWDRIIRHQRHYRAILCYISDNPHEAALREGEYILWQNDGEQKGAQVTHL